eukprot:14901968-Alexandrium_andersonii.AAC.1
MAPLVFLALTPGPGKPRDMLQAVDEADILSDKGLNLIFEALDAEYLGRPYKRAEEAVAAYETLRRLPREAMATFIQKLKVARSVLSIDDPGTTVSDIAYAQRMLRQANIPRSARRQ